MRRILVGDYMELKIKSLYKSYKEKKVFEDFSISMKEGIYGLLGPNGSGKSTLMNILSLNLNRDKGEIFLNGKDIIDLDSSYRRLLGYMPQQQALYDDFSGVEFLTYMASLKGMDKNIVKKEITYFLDRVELTEYAYFKTKTYSGGMKQRLLLAATLLGNPKIIILDEPTAGLDPKQRVHIRNLIKDVSIGKIVLIATHVLSDVEPLADIIVFMKNGEILKEHKQNGQSLEKLYMYYFEDEVY